ncbi:hypothetical protein ACHAQA_008478 [Verticillium albo-atrum]
MSAHHEPTRIFPSTTPPPTTASLSILDNTVARFTPTGAIWVFETKPSVSKDDLLSRLQTSFITALSSFPHFAGQLHWDTSNPRFNRAAVTYGSPSDPGVEWTVASSSLAPFIPTGAIWEGTFPQNELLASKTQLALHDLRTWEGLPAMIVQITLLPEGYAIAVKLAHPLADAHTLLLFMHHWSAASESRHPAIEPVFNPSLLDAHAGDVLVRDEALTAKARALPLHRYDWWATTAPSYPSFLTPTTENSKPKDEALLAEALRSDVATPPWQTWDMHLPVRHAILRFAPKDLEALRVEGASTLDALLAHVWAAITRARGFAADAEDEVFLDVTLGARPRTSPPLGEGFVGSPLLIAHVGLPAQEVVARSAAGQIRSCLRRFTPEAVGAVLHDAALEVAPQRLWQAFLGRRHVLVTAWLRIGVYNVEFFGQKAAWVHAVMPRMDGCVQVMEGHEGGMDVSVYLEAEAMGRLLKDQELGISGRNV